MSSCFDITKQDLVEFEKDLYMVETVLLPLREIPEFEEDLAYLEEVFEELKILFQEAKAKKTLDKRASIALIAHFSFLFTLLNDFLEEQEGESEFEDEECCDPSFH